MRLPARRQLRLCGLGLAAIGVIALAAPASAITSGQIDDFQDGTTQGWGTPAINPNPPVVVADVGPAGAGDDSLQITSTGGIGAGSRLIAMNTTQWTGDYTAAGVTMVVADVNNIGATSLSLRLAFDGAGGQFSSTLPVSLAPGSGWEMAAFPIEAADLTSVGGTDVGATLANATELRILSAASPAFIGDAIAAQLLVDNLVAVPEPSELWLIAAGVSTLVALRRLRSSRAKSPGERPARLEPVACATSQAAC